MIEKLVHTVILLFLVALFAVQDASGQEQSQDKVRLSGKRYLHYLAWTPSSNAEKRLPLLIFLHGAGERGTNLELVKKWGPPSFVEQRSEFPFIVISPQCPEDQWWNVDDLQKMLKKVLRKYPVDRNRIYLSGLSMGGFGTWHWACAFPDQFAAIAPVCGGGNVLDANKLVRLPIWAFHGEDDPVVPASNSILMVDSVNLAGGDAKLTLYPGVGHDSWIQAYSDEELYRWLLSKRRKP